MKSIRTKIMLPVYVMTGLFLIFIAAQAILVLFNLSLVRQMENTNFATIYQADQLKLNVTQVQQWVTDVSATHDTGGLETADGYAQQVRSVISTLKTLNPGRAAELDAISASFEPYYETGKKMASTYVSSGIESGNKLMAEFDATAADINTKIDTFISHANTEIGTAATRIEVSIRRSVMLSVFAAFVTLFLCGGTFVMIAKNVLHPIRTVQAAVRELAQGNLKVKLTFKSNDEIGRLADDTRDTASELNSYISDINRCLGALSKGDLTVSPNVTFRGDFVELRNQLVAFGDSINQTMLHINETATQVASGAEQLSIGAQSLAQGAEEQSASVQQLTATITTVSSSISGTAHMAEQANSLAERVGNDTKSGNEQMHNMVAAMAEISNSSKEIGKIIKTIEDIAFQTNILALNAAVEAARAGAAGKGFAVVADEVRNLAGKSAEAAKNTTALIQQSISAVANGSGLVDETAQSLSSVADGIGEVVSAIGNISRAAGEQVEAIESISSEVTQIAQVVHTVSSTAEESSSASTELSSLSDALREQVDFFKLKEE